MNKLIKGLLIIGGAITVSSMAFLLFTMSRMEFNFANEGKIICVTKKDWGFGSKGELTCFNISPVGAEKEELRFNCKTINGEIVVSK